MPDRRTILLTNDDGIDAVGLAALREALDDVADLRVVAPMEDRSGQGRTDSRRFTVEERAGGHAVDGTPVDCVHYGLRGLPGDVDLVVSGANPGPNLGTHNLERSGTIGAAREAAFLGVPAIAVSIYDPVEGGLRAAERPDFARAERVARFLVERLLGDDGESCRFDYLNVNVPAVDEERPLRVTEPVLDVDVSLTRQEEGLAACDHFYDPLRPDVDEPVSDPVGTDRRALADGEVSVTPLRVPWGTADTDAVDTLLDVGESA